MPQMQLCVTDGSDKVNENKQEHMSLHLEPMTNNKPPVAVLQRLRQIKLDAVIELQLMAFCMLHDLTPPYLNQLVHVADLPRHCQHTYCMFNHSVYRLSAVDLFPSQHPFCGIPCRRIFSFYLLYLSSVNV